MKTSVIIFILLVVGFILFIKWLNSPAQQAKEEEAKRLRIQESQRRRLEDYERRIAECEERMKKYRVEYEEYIRKSNSMSHPQGVQPLSFDEWRRFYGKH